MLCVARASQRCDAGRFRHQHRLDQRAVRMRKLFTFVVVIVASVLQLQSQDRGVVEWPYWGGDAANSRYSTLADISPANVNQLERAWEWNTGEMPNAQYGSRPGAFEATPIMIDNVVYISTPYHRVVALDAETGKQLWAFDPEAWKGAEDSIGFKHRGIAFWRDRGDLRIFLNTDTRLFSLDAKTGKPVTTFGRAGVTSLVEGMRLPVKKLHTSQTSPPVVYKNLVIVGSRIPDRIQYKFETQGTVQAYDAKTGKRAWIFNTIPQSSSDFGANTWENESWNFTGHANVWGPMTLDEPRGLLYIPVSTAGSDYWGGRRPGANLFAESVVCLDAATGKRKWHFQAVHHGLWDYDFTAAPNLITITVDGKRIDAVAEVSKQGFTYVFDRVTGTPVWPIEERPVDTRTEVPGERPYATQPFPTKPPPFSTQGISLDDANDLTPEIKALATEQLKKFQLGPLFTPPSLRGTIQRPSVGGGANWGGAGIDPETGWLYVRSSESYTINQVCKNDGSAADVDVDYSNNCEFGAAANIFERADGKPVRSGGEDTGTGSKLGPIPLTKPPYALLTAINLNKGEIAWRAPFGEGSAAIRRHPLLKGVTLPDRLGTQGSASVLVTRNGLVFIGGGDSYLYAFDKTTGKELWRVATPGRTGGNAMTYRSRSGRQFVLIASGAGPDATLTAFALGAGRPAATTSTTSSGSGALAGAQALAGADTYGRVCQTCHGPNGRGGVGPALVPMTKAVDEVLGIVREGFGEMPPISARELSDEDVARIVEHLRATR
jgi:quinoprotein glucose dehydrogenase